MTPHLYPARPGMLRIGTRVEPGPHGPTPVGDGKEAGGVVVFGPSQYGWLVVFTGADSCDWYAEELMLDLRDVTARAHAAMVYTWVNPAAFLDRYPEDDSPEGETHPSGRIGAAIMREDREHSRQYGWVNGHALCWTHGAVLRRMRCMDESVTVAEARAALDWAHAASGGGE